MNKTNIRVTKQFTFDMAHALYGYDGPCKNIHGHTYRLSVTLKGNVISDVNSPKLGMVLDFTELKGVVNSVIIKTYDHALVLSKHSPHAELVPSLKEQFEKIILLEYQPTCENLLLCFRELISNSLDSTYELVYLKLEETPTSYAEWLVEDN